MKKLLILLMICLFPACQNTEATLTEAEESLPFHILQPSSLSEGWKVKETIYEEDLVVIVYKHEKEGTIELIQDQHIQGLNQKALKQYMEHGEWSSYNNLDTRHHTLVIDKYIGEWTILPEEERKMQYTFVRQFDLYAEPRQGISYYQVTGQDVTSEEVVSFVETLSGVTS
ncbi:hypothetical protein [Alkalicoccus halolimnae]|uniref:Lipoprotein n=1 Tax=Alkalicoccus halolimnae TaxID=1667239 RepID=A0A5C7F9A7_9BACI|nr:hypothetical protein [Alkalicoccus halolimnae]TXF86623.1 hypothetical protein FTX54_05175 [Alkalicoccus halolimnae]